VLKIDFHTHTSDDPQDRIPHSAHQLIERAAVLGYDGLAITLHDRQLRVEPLRAHAESRGVVLIPGIEKTVCGRHVLLLNFPADAAEAVESFEDLARLKRAAGGLVVAPHPFFPGGNSLFGRLDLHAGLFDAVEFNAMFTSTLNFNVRAERWARAHGRPMVGNGDVHRLTQLGTTYSLVDADRDPSSICRAVARGHVRVVSRPLTWGTAVGIIASIVTPARVRAAFEADPLPSAGASTDRAGAAAAPIR
jgi:predicted metal-dependent phosphoesterase TrpH